MPFLKEVCKVYTIAYAELLYSLEDIIYIDFQNVKEYFENNNIDLAICDHFSDACYSAAKMLDIPYIITAAIPITEGKYDKALYLYLT